jgi:hypothetical protein
MINKTQRNYRKYSGKKKLRNTTKKALKNNQIVIG